MNVKMMKERGERKKTFEQSEWVKRERRGCVMNQKRFSPYITRPSLVPHSALEDSLSESSSSVKESVVCSCWEERG